MANSQVPVINIPLARDEPNPSLMLQTQDYSTASLSVRGELSKAVERSPGQTTSRPGPNPKHLEYIKRAIDDGDGLLKSGDSPKHQADRRALIVAPLYLDYEGRGDGLGDYGSMIETIKDAYLIHKLLVERYGYERCNIRILTDGSDEAYYGSIFPTRDNILKSLDWLVRGARSTDRRFFHFSGHGGIFEASEGNGKRAKTRVDLALTTPTDTERYLPKPRSYQSDPGPETYHFGPGRIRKQIIPKSRLGFFREAILTKISYTVGPQQEIVYRVTDQELNGRFSQLPEGCRLTCLLDCCHSGRMIDNAIKLEGGGFRGKREPMIQAPKIIIPDRSDSMDIVAQSPESTHQTEYEEPEASENIEYQDENVVMFEELPEDELSRDNIVAQTLTWGASHQRQYAISSERFKCGLLTQAFTDILREPGTISVEDFHAKLDQVVRSGSGRIPQFVQVRMSPKSATPESQDAIRKGPVVL